MSEEFTIPQDVFIFKLAKALQMEHDMMEDLGTFQKAVQSREVKDFFKNHQKETKEQIKRLERCFELLDKPATPRPSPTATGIRQEADTAIRKTSKELVDGVVLAASLSTEHHEMAMYETLITLAEPLGEKEIVELLKETLKEEQETADEGKKLAATVVTESTQKMS